MGRAEAVDEGWEPVDGQVKDSQLVKGNASRLADLDLVHVSGLLFGELLKVPLHPRNKPAMLDAIDLNGKAPIWAVNIELKAPAGLWIP
jgi:hypothetical protein